MAVLDRKLMKITKWYRQDSPWKSLINWIFKPPTKLEVPLNQLCNHRPYGDDCESLAEYFINKEYLCQDCADLCYDLK